MTFYEGEVGRLVVEAGKPLWEVGDIQPVMESLRAGDEVMATKQYRDTRGTSVGVAMAAVAYLKKFAPLDLER